MLIFRPFSKLGRNKCLKEFPTSEFNGKIDYSGYNREEWKLRTKEGHENTLLELEDATCRTSLETLESWLGVRYSVLTDLPFLSQVGFLSSIPCITCCWEHLRMSWICGLKENFDYQWPTSKRGKSKLPFFLMMLAGFLVRLTAAFQGLLLRIWTTVISPIVLKGILPAEDLNCWLLFVNACQLLITWIIIKIV